MNKKDNKEEAEIKSRPQRLSGVVVKAGSMAKTVTVKVERLAWHPRVRKQIKRAKNYLAHDEEGELKEGERVVIEKCRPLSAQKHFRVVSSKKSDKEGEKQER